MRKRTRTILFLTCLILFVFSAPSVVLYSQGYRFDFEKKKITQTGGIFLKVEPKQVEIYIDGKFSKKTDFFFGSALVENLLPKNHKIEVKKEGYYTWEKNSEIKEKEVAEFKNVVLFPKNVNFNILSQATDNFWLSPNGEKIILKESNEQGWALKLYDINKNLKSHLLKDKDISQRSQVDLLNVDWSADSNEIYLNVGLREQEKNFILKLDKIPPTLKEEAVEKTNKTDDKISPDNKKVAIFDNSEIRIMFLKDILDQPQRKAGDKVFLVRLSEKIGNAFWLDNNYLIFNADNKIKIIETDDRSRINMIDLAIYEKPTIFWDINKKKLYVLSGKNLYQASLKQ